MYYKLTKQNIDFSVYEIPQGIDERFGWTWLETEIKNTIESDYGITIFFQEAIPNCESKYWKVDNNIVVEMSVSEKEYKDKQLLYEQTKSDQRNYRYKIMILSDPESIYVMGVTYWAAKTTPGVPEFDFNYIVLDKWINSRKGYTMDQYADDYGQIIVLCNELDDSFLAMIENDNRFTLFDVEILNPNN